MCASFEGISHLLTTHSLACEEVSRWLRSPVKEHPAAFKDLRKPSFVALLKSPSLISNSPLSRERVL